MNYRFKGSLATIVAVATAGAMAPLGAQESPDAKFLMDAIRANMAEIKVGELAEKSAASEGARDYGHMLAQDHAKALQKHAALARDRNIAVPTEVTAEQKQTYDELSKLSGAAFDRQFAAHMVTDHQKAIAMYEKESSSGTDKEVTALAKSTLPALEQHLEKAQSLGTARTSQRVDPADQHHLE